MKKVLWLMMVAMVGLAGAEEIPVFRIGGLTFHFHPAWQISPQKRPMSAGTMVYKKDGKAVGPSADFYHFGAGQGGGVQANIARWKQQFKAGATVKEETRKVGERSWHFVRIDGTFMKGRPFGPKTETPGQRMLGAIVEDPGGTIFVKLVDGQAAVSEPVEKAFLKLIESSLK